MNKYCPRLAGLKLRARANKIFVSKCLELSSSEVTAINVGGLAGLSAAHTVLEKGGDVILLDKNGFLGGNSTKATSGINGSGTSAQIKLGIPVFCFNKG